MYGFDDVKTLLARLRDENTGCPWNVKQTIDSLLPHTLDEASEAVDALARHDWPHSEEELGDLLYQIVFYAHIAAEQGHFSLDSVVDALVRKMVRRHPHVFPDGTLYSRRGAGEALSEAQAQAHFYAQKQAEKSGEQAPEAAHCSAINFSSTTIGQNEPLREQGVLDDIAAPPLQRAYRLQSKAAGVGFDWPSPEGAMDKLIEEVDEVREAMALDDGANKKQQLTHEIGDVLFSAINLARHYGIAPEVALSGANRRFTERFAVVEAHANEHGGFEHCDLALLKSAWQLAKKASK